MLYYLILFHKFVIGYYELCLHDLQLVRHHHQYVRQVPTINKRIEQNEIKYWVLLDFGEHIPKIQTNKKEKKGLETISELDVAVK